MGFCDQSYFGTVFRKLVGMTPAAIEPKREQSRPHPTAITARIPLAFSRAALQPSTRVRATIHATAPFFAAGWQEGNFKWQ